MIQGDCVEKFNCTAMWPGSSLDCAINVECEKEWYNETHATVMQMYDSAYELGCGYSHTFINNTSEDSSPYIIAAKHVINIPPGWEEGQVAATWYRFNFQSSTCSNDIISTDTLTARLRYEVRSVNYAVDYALIELTPYQPWLPDVPGHNYDVYDLPIFLEDAQVTLAGWSRLDAAPSHGSIIGHPCGDLKKIAFASNYSIPVNSPTRLQATIMHGDGVVQVGSSGSGMYDENHLWVAAASGGGTSGDECPEGSENVLGPRLAYMWNDIALDPARRVSAYLDEAQTGAVSVQPLALYNIVIENEVFDNPNTDLARGFFRTSKSITTTNTSITTNGLTSGSLQLHARESITINGPFAAEIGTSFSAAPVPAVGSALYRQHMSHINHLANSDHANTNNIVFSVSPNYPNPFSDVTYFDLTLSESEHVSLTVYDLLGRGVARPIDRFYEAGEYQIDWAPEYGVGRALPSGVYLYRLQAGNRIVTGTMTLVR